VIGSIAAMVALLAGGWFVGAQPLLAAASAASDTSSQVAATNQTSQIRLAGLQKQSKNLSELKDEEATAAAAVPESLDANGFVTGINTIAASVGVTVQSVSPGTAQAYSPPASITTADQVAAAAAAPAPSASPSASAAPVAAAAPTVPVLAASDPSISAANFTLVPMTVSVKGQREGTLRFTHALQNDKRLFLVTGYSLSTDGQSGGTVLATLNGFIYALKH
jgi:hypothetical protein